MVNGGSDIDGVGDDVVSGNASVICGSGGNEEEGWVEVDRVSSGRGGGHVED